MAQWQCTVQVEKCVREVWNNYFNLTSFTFKLLQLLQDYFGYKNNAVPSKLLLLPQNYFIYLKITSFTSKLLHFLQNYFSYFKIIFVTASVSSIPGTDLNTILLFKFSMLFLLHLISMLSTTPIVFSSHSIVLHNRTFAYCYTLYFIWSWSTLLHTIHVYIPYFLLSIYLLVLAIRKGWLYCYTIYFHFILLQSNLLHTIYIYLSPWRVHPFPLIIMKRIV